MAICSGCGRNFKKKKAREEFNSYFNDEDLFEDFHFRTYEGVDYDDIYPDGDYCFECAKDYFLENMSAFDNL